MKQVYKPFVCLNDWEAIRKYSAEQQPDNVWERIIPMHTIRVGYPVADWSRGEVKEWTIEQELKESVRSLLGEINACVTDAIRQGLNYGPHVAEDYCIECVTIEDGVCTVEFGS